MIKGFFFILLFYFLGQLVSLLIHGFIPGSVIGMILLFLALFFKVINPENVRSTAAAVGLMAYIEIVSRNFLAIIVGIAISTILTIVTVALVQERMEKRGKKGDTAHE